MSPADAVPYLARALGQLPRLLSKMDREPQSQTYGCVDRTYWAWKFTDFAGARFQEAAYALAYVYSDTARDNVLSGHTLALEWTRASIAFWRRLQYPDGSFDEAYPYEHSLAATAFSSFYVGEAFLLVRNQMAAPEVAVTMETFRRAGDWLCRNDERHGVLSNHQAAAAAALTVIHQITGDAEFTTRAGYFLQSIYDRQSTEGWYEEYGGADPGYQTHATFYLARVWQLTRDEQLLHSLKRSVAFLKHFIHPDGTLGGEYGSRNTEFYFPAGLEILATACPDAAAIARFMRPSVENQISAGVEAMDAYNILPMLNNYLFAAQVLYKEDAEHPLLPFQLEGEWEFPDAGLVVASRPRYFAVIGLSKGGVVKLFQRDAGGARLLASDCGWWASLANGTYITSQALTRQPVWRREDGTITVEAMFARINQRNMTPWLFVAFRLFCLLFGRWQAVAYRVKGVLVHVLVSRKRKAPVLLTRHIELGEGFLKLSDCLVTEPALAIHAISPSNKFTSVHMGSARYFQRAELGVAASCLSDPRQLAEELRRNGRLLLERSWEC